MIAARPLFRVLLLSLPLALVVSGCETMEKLNPFAENQTPLPGERRPLFPEGVPGVDFGAPPPQPTNSNIPISPAMTEPEPEQAGQQQAQAPRSPQPGSSNTKAGTSGDAWDGTR